MVRGTLAGNIFANTNGGTVVEVNLATQLPPTIATGGSRGDFVTVDPNGTLLLTQTDSIDRLTAPIGGSFLTPESASSILMAGMGCLGAARVYARRKVRVVKSR